MASRASKGLDPARVLALGRQGLTADVIATRTGYSDRAVRTLLDQAGLAPARVFHPRNACVSDRKRAAVLKLHALSIDAEVIGIRVERIVTEFRTAQEAEKARS